MRIAFCGKGGSGKTTLASLFIRYLDHHHHPVLAIDGDINQHLGHALGFSAADIAALPKLGQRQDVLQNYVRGQNPRIRKAEDIIESTPAGSGSRLITRAGGDPVSAQFMAVRGNIRFMGVGGHEAHDIGATCFHKFTGAEGIFLNHYLDGDDEYVVGDMCAGADPFASSGLATRYDAIFLVLEPTLKSLAVYHQAQAYARPHGVRIYPVANKIMSAGDIHFINDHIGEDCLCDFSALDIIRDAERGIAFSIEMIDQRTQDSLAAMSHTVAALPPRDWARYQSVGFDFHRRAAAEWASAMYGYDLNEQIDPDYLYREVA